MANSEGRKGGMNFHPKQLQREWKPKEGPSTFGILNKGLDDVNEYLAGSMVCEHFNPPFDCPVCRR
jgi:hypothetical protein